MTRRPPLALAAFALLAAWVSAQGPGSGPSAADSLRMLKLNRPLLDDLTRHGLALGDRNTPLDRADECRRVADRLAREVRAAVRDADADRLAEVSDHLKGAVAHGLVPNLKDARRSIPAQSREFERLEELHRAAYSSLVAVAEAVPADGEVAKSPRTQAARAALAAAAAAVGPWER